MAAPASDWLRHFRLPWRNRWTEFNETLQEASSQSLLPRLCFFRPIGKKQNGRPGLWLAETFSTSPLKPLKGIQRNLIGSVFQVDRKNKMATPAYDLLRHFQLFLWNRWIEFNKTWQEARSQHPLPGLRFSGWSEKRDSRPVLWLAETFSTSPMKPLNRIQRNLTESKFSTSSSKFVFFGIDPKNNMAALASDLLRHILTFHLKPLNGIQRNLTGSKILTSSTKFCFSGRKVNKTCHPGQSIKEAGTLYSGARYGAPWASCSPFQSQFFYAFIVLRWATVASWASCSILCPCDLDLRTQKCIQLFYQSLSFIWPTLRKIRVKHNKGNSSVARGGVKWRSLNLQKELFFI